MKLLVDDVCKRTISNLKYLDELRCEYRDIKIVLFVIAYDALKDKITDCKEFLDYSLDVNVEIGLHAYDHMYPPEQERNDAEDYMRKAIEIVGPYLAYHALYRPPGFQRTIRTEIMCAKLGFSGIAYQKRIKWFGRNGQKPQYEYDFINCHLTENQYHNPIGRWREWINLYRLKKIDIINI